MSKVLVSDIEQKQKVNFVFENKIDEIDADVYADLILENLGEYIKVSGDVNGKLPLICDRCLKEYDYEFDLKIEEVYAKGGLYEEYGQETELKEGQFIIDLEGAKEIDIYDLLYQSVILTLPNKKVCGINCSNVGHFMSEEEITQTDSRMSVFKNIKVNR